MDKPDVAALIARLSHIAADRFGDRGSPDLCGEAAAALQSQQARIAELESALREIADMSSDDVTECCIAREALKGSPNDAL